MNSVTTFMRYTWNTFSPEPLHLWTVMDYKGILLQLVKTLVDNATVLSCIGVLSITTYQSFSNKRKQEETLAKLTQIFLIQLKRKQIELTSNEETSVTEHAHTIEKEKANLVELIDTGNETITELICRGTKTLKEQSETIAKEKAALVQLINRKTLNEQDVRIEHDNKPVFDQSTNIKRDKETFNECIVKEKITLIEFVEKEKNTLTEFVEKEKVKLTELIEKEKVTLTELVEKEKSKLTELIEKEKSKLTELIGKEKLKLTDLIREGDIHLTEQTLNEPAALIEKMKETFTKSISTETETLLDQPVHTKKELNTLTEEIPWVNRENENLTDFIKIEKDKLIKYAERIERVKNEWVELVKQAEGRLSENANKMRKETETLFNQALRIEQVELVMKKENKLIEQTA